MRRFNFKGKHAMLNGKTYFMRGTNVCIFRFFEDPDRKNLPWDRQWVIKLHQKFKDMNWNSIRYCIGFPPEDWYEIADSLGFLIQDEYPIWTGRPGRFERIQPGINSNHIANEYKDWMQEHFNHACVVIWDGQNESVSDTIAKAINKARKNDLSKRPWDNGWSAPASSEDCIESHPYLFVKYKAKGITPGPEGVLSEFFSEIRIPDNDPNEHDPSTDGKRYENPIIVNEYGWLWLNRDGTPTTLTDNVYKNVFPEATTNEQRFEVYAKHLGILTEYWRAHRLCAGVLHFCGLGSSRPKHPRGQTCDNFVDIKNLNYEPNFYQYVKPAFSPVGIMLEFWNNKLKGGQKIKIPVHIINDTYENWNDTVRITLTLESKVVRTKVLVSAVDALGKKIEYVEIEFPEKPGQYKLIGELTYKNERIKSIREIEVK